MTYPHWISASLKDLDAAARIAAVTIGGAWAYIKFFKGRVFYQRLEPTVSGDARIEEDCVALAISLKLKNVGLSRVNIRQSGSGLRISAAEKVVPKSIIAAIWVHLGTFPIMEKHEWIGAEETINEDKLLILPKNVASTDLLLEINVMSGRHMWAANCIVIPRIKDV